jgi:hypothetical protein
VGQLADRAVRTTVHDQPHGSAGEAITFEVDKPGGGKFSGQRHAASPDGVVCATYQSSGDDPETYTVVATGHRGTSVRGTFTVG